ncbi:hypothetical protein BC832DRAFT_213249 [Gaertneriomyces semiglobifer]|nr:hypothetical protein BC832DRAFT_213249 [Gaertneriomyces semiglobifer]
MHPSSFLATLHSSPLIHSRPTPPCQFIIVIVICVQSILIEMPLVEHVRVTLNPPVGNDLMNLLLSKDPTGNRRQLTTIRTTTGERPRGQPSAESDSEASRFIWSVFSCRVYRRPDRRRECR